MTECRGGGQEGMVSVDCVLLQLLLLRYGAKNCKIFSSLVPKLRNELTHLSVP